MASGKIRRVGAFLAASAFLSARVLAAPAPVKAAKSDVLLRIVSRCLDLDARSSAEDCALCPALPTTSPDVCRDDPRRRSAACGETLRFWNRGEEEYFALAPGRRPGISVYARYLVMEDIKMCRAREAGFTHGLLIARAPMTGVEDQGRFDLYPDAWKAAWEAAKERIEERSIVLAANPPIPKRSQNQFHVHLARLRPGARRKIRGEKSLGRCAALDGCVWATVKRLASEAGYVPDIDHGYGVAVLGSDDGKGWTVVVVSPDKSPEAEFAQSVP